MRSSVSWVASTAPWPARAWSEWPWVMTALSTARVGSIWKPPTLQQRPADVRRRISSGRMTLRYDGNGAMTGGTARPVGASTREPTKSHVWRAAVALLAVALLTPAVAQDKPEVPKPRLAVGGQSAIFYLPLSITERLGYFRGAGLDVEIGRASCRERV